MGDFLPDASIQAAEDGKKLIPLPMSVYADRCEDLNSQLLFYVGFTPEWWDQVIHILRTHTEPTGASLAEMLERGFRDLLRG